MSSPPRGGRKRATQGVCGNHLLGFSTSRHDHKATYKSNARQYHGVFDRSTFLAANFRFGLCRIDDHTNVDWDDVVFLDMEAPISSDGVSGMRCPISLDDVELPYITPCGHVFGLVPLLTDMLMKHDGVIRGTSPCPICNVEICAAELRPVQIRYVRQDPDTVEEFTRVWRYRGSAVVHTCGEEDVLDTHGYYPIHMPRFSRSVLVENPEVLWKYIACRLAEMSEEVRLEGGQDAACYYPAYIAAIDVVVDHCRKMGERGFMGENYQGIIDDIRQNVKNSIEASQALEASRLRERQIEEEFPSLSVSSNRIIDSSSCGDSLLWKTCIVQCHLPAETESDDGKMYMYQKSDGQWTFLNLLNMKMLYAWKGNYDDLPSTISGRVLDIERFEQTEETRKRMRPCSHIPNRANITLCELDLGELLPQEVVDTFQQELSRRRARREAVARQKARALRMQKQAEKESRETAVVDFRDMPPLVDTEEESAGLVEFGSVEGQDGVSFAKIAELGFAALGPSLTEAEASSSPPIAAQDSVWTSRNRNTPSEPTVKKKGSKQILLFSTSQRQY